MGERSVGTKNNLSNINMEGEMLFDFSSLFRFVKNDYEAILFLTAIYNIVKQFRELYKNEKITKLYLAEEVEDVISLVIETDKNKYGVVIRDSGSFIISPKLEKTSIHFYVED